MKKLILALSVVYILSTPKTYIILPTQADNSVPTSSPQLVHRPKKEIQDIPAYIAQEAQRYGIDPKVALFVAGAESNFKTGAIGDDGYKCPTGGKSPQKTRSRGVYQISDCYHPEVSDKCAYNLECATTWTMKYVSKNGWREWSTFKKYTP